jgi:Isochorismatase family
MTSHANSTRDVKADAGNTEKAKGRPINLDAKPEAITLDPVMTAVIVVDMQNDFGSKGGMFDRAGIDISGIQEAVGPTAKVLAAARSLGIKIIYLKMGYKPDLSDLGAPQILVVQPVMIRCVTPNFLRRASRSVSKNPLYRVL